MPATTARGTDASRTEEAAPVVLEDVLEGAAGDAALLVLDVEDERVVTSGAVGTMGAEVLFEDERVGETGGPDASVVVRSGGVTVAVTESVITVGSVSMFPSSLCTK